MQYRKNIKGFVKIIFFIFVIAFILNFVWEILHYPLYNCKIPLGVCARVTAFRDALIILGMYFAGVFLFKDLSWISRITKGRAGIAISASFVIAYIIELQGIYFGKWEYGALMPIIPVLDVGLSPVLQMMILPLLTFFMAGRILKGEKSFIPAAGFNSLTPLFDLFCRIIGLGKGYRRKIIEKTGIPNKKLKVLDAGCGTGSLVIELKRLMPRLNVYAIDADERILSIARIKAEKEKVRINFKKAFLQKLPFPDNYFDFVYSSLVLHHLKTADKEEALKEIYRVLRKGGSFLLVDFGRPKNLISSLFSLFSIIFEDGYDNFQGKIPKMLLNIKFKNIRRIGGYRYNIQFLGARK